MIDLHEAWKIIRSVKCQMRSEAVAVENCLGRIVSEHVYSPINVAPFRNSAMDGFAVNSSRLKSFPARLRVGTTLYAGGEVLSADYGGEAIKVMTGAVVPDEFDSVVPIEDVEYAEPFVTLASEPRPGQHVRLPGEDVGTGEIIVSKGKLIGPFEIGVLVSVGLKAVNCFSRPRVLLVSTGDELVQPGVKLKPGQLYDSNSFTVASMIERYCHSVDRLRCHADDLPSLMKTLDSDHDLVITSGGVSAGEKDFVPLAAKKTDWVQKFHKVAVKPGKPTLFATRGNKFLFGLPGNPLAAAVTCAIFVLPFLKRMIGYENTELIFEPARLDGPAFKSNRTVIWPGTVDRTGADLTVRFSPKRSSAALSALLNSDGLVIQNSSDKLIGEQVGLFEWSKTL